MTQWDSQHYRSLGQKEGVSNEIIDAAIETSTRLTKYSPALPPVLTLRHLAHLVDIDFQFLRRVVERKEAEPYDVFRIRKNGKENAKSFRIICVPDYRLMRVQRWIAENILNYTHTHEASFAFTQGKKIKDAAVLHCECEWMIKMDVCRFFESISEISVYRVFRKLGYEPLISFEMTRLCTRLGTLTHARQKKQWQSKAYGQEIQRYFNRRIGHLPQGAPTSPMLSNLVMTVFDIQVSKIAQKNGLIYTRYADDLCLSKTNKDFSRKQASRIIGNISSIMGQHGLSPNFTKTKVSPPGSRKIILGLLGCGLNCTNI